MPLGIKSSELATFLGWQEPWFWLRARRVKVLLACAVGMSAGALANLLIPPEYEIDVVLQPSAQDSPQLGGNLAAIASRFGVRPNIQNSPLDYFALVLQTDTVLRAVLRARFVGGIPTANASVGAQLLSYYRRAETVEDEAVAKAVRRFTKDVVVESDIPSNTIRLSVTLDDPVLALSVARTLVSESNKYLEQLNSEVHRAERLFLERQVQLANAELGAREDSLRKFYERNRNFAQSPELKLEENRTVRRVQLAEDNYLSLSRQLAQTRLDEARNTPVLLMVEPGVIPASPSLTHQLFFVAMFGLAAATLWIGLEILRVAVASPAVKRDESLKGMEVPSVHALR